MTLRTVADEWARLRSAIGFDDAPPRVSEHLRRGFYSGCAVSIDVFSECADMDEASAEAQLTAWTEELRAFIFEVSSGGKA